MTGRMSSAGDESEENIRAALAASGLVPAGADIDLTPLTGGVSSDIWKVVAGSRVFVVKRALPKLRVAADWRAPVSRNSAEADWMRVVRTIAPDAAPEVLMQDVASGLFAMPYFPPHDYPLWKAELHAGRVDPGFAAKVGRTIALIHNATADDGEMAERFANDATFHAIRLEPYLEATASRYPALADTLMSLSRATLGCKRALVHGDVSPKNILVGATSPLFLDAECAWYGDPAFDLAFCLNHLLLKCLWNREAAPRFLAAFDELANAYLDAATFSPREEIDRRAAALLPALFLARIDGKSPVEYVTNDADRDLVRAVAVPLIARPRHLKDVRAAWAAVVDHGS